MRVPLDPPPAEGQGVLVEAGAERIAVFRAGDTYHAFEDQCPHRAGPLSEGSLELTRRGTLVTCPFHGWQFDLATGACATVRGKAIRTYPVVADETGGLWIVLPDEP